MKAQVIRVDHGQVECSYRAADGKQCTTLFPRVQFQSIQRDFVGARVHIHFIPGEGGGHQVSPRS